MLSLLVLSTAFAGDNDKAEEPKFPIVKPSGVFFPSYAYNLTDGADGANAFSIDRVYLRTDVTINKRFSARVTLDADHVKPTGLPDGSTVTVDTKYRLFVKHAYLQVNDLGPTKLRFGMVETAFAPSYDAFVGKRYIYKSLGDANGIVDTADLGVQWTGRHLDGLVDWNVSVLNGEGYAKPEIDAGKTAQIKLTVDPLAPKKKMELPITGFFSYGGHPSTDTQTLVAGGSLGFKMPRFIGWGEALYRTDTTNGSAVSGLGYSVTLNPRLPKYVGVFGRYDHFDADISSAGDGTTTIIAGLEHDFYEKVSLAATYERSWNDAAPDAPTHAIVLHAQAGF